MCLLNTYYMLGLVFGPRVGDHLMSCAPPENGLLCSTTTHPPPTTGTRGGRRRESLHKDTCSALLPKTMASSPAAQILFSSFPSAVRTTSGFKIKGDTLADEFTARCQLLECTTVHLIQSTRNRRAPPPPGPRTPHDVTSPRQEPAKTIPGTAARFGMEKNWAAGKSRSRTMIRRIQAAFRLRETTATRGKSRGGQTVCCCPEGPLCQARAPNPEDRKPVHVNM